MEYLPIPALLISIVSLVLAFVSFRRTKIFQEYEYAPRLELTDEQAQFGSPTLSNRPALTYSAEVENSGSKPVEINSIYLDYGASDDSEKRMKYHVTGRMYLSPGQKHAFTKVVDWTQVEEMKQRFNINQARFFLRVSYRRPNGTMQSSTRSIGEYDGNSTVFVVQPGTRLT